MKKTPDAEIGLYLSHCKECSKPAEFDAGTHCAEHLIARLLGESGSYAPHERRVVQLLRSMQQRLEVLEKQYHGHVEYLHPGKKNKKGKK